MTQPHLILGNANYSSWSMRPYLVLRRAGIEFTTEFLPIRTDAFRARLSKVSPFALVPTLVLGDDVIGDSLAIAEWAAEQNPTLWPRDEMRRASARMLTAQMHGGFGAIRAELPMNLKRVGKPRAELSEAVMADVSKLSAAWGQCLKNYGGPFLFGEWSIADAFYTPVATRLRSYGIGLPHPLQNYVETLLKQSDYVEWETLAKAESWVIDDVDQNFD